MPEDAMVDAELEQQVRDALSRRAALAADVETPERVVGVSLGRTERGRWMIAAAAVLAVAVVVSVAVALTRGDTVRVVDPAGTTTVPPDRSTLEPLVFAHPTGALWRDATAAVTSSAPAQRQYFRRSGWPEGVTARVDEFDTFQPLVGDIKQFTADFEAGGRTLRRWPQRPGPTERRWVEADGRGFSVVFSDADGSTPGWDERAWHEALAGLMESLRYESGRFIPTAPTVEVPEPVAPAAASDESALPWSELERDLLWRVGDDRFMLSAYRDRHLDLAVHSERSAARGDPIEVRGHRALVGTQWIAWRENASTVVVLGRSWRNLDAVMLGEVVVVGFPSSPEAIDVSLATSALTDLRPIPAADYDRIDRWYPASRQPNLVVQLPRGVDPPLWLRYSARDGGVRSVAFDAAPRAQQWAAALRLEPGDLPVTIWAAREPFGPWDPPGCAVRVASISDSEQRSVTLGHACIVAAR